MLLPLCMASLPVFRFASTSAKACRAPKQFHSSGLIAVWNKGCALTKDHAAGIEWCKENMLYSVQRDVTTSLSLHSMPVVLTCNWKCGRKEQGNFILESLKKHETGQKRKGAGRQWEMWDLVAMVCSGSYSLFSKPSYPILHLRLVPVTEPRPSIQS